jgi:hypothetical protein
MQLVTLLWRGLWHQLVTVGNPDVPVSWQVKRYDAFATQYPPADLGRLVFTGGGIRILLFRWLTLVDPHHNHAYYQPFIWLEFVPTISGERKAPLDAIAGAHLAFHLIVPFDRARISLLLPFSLRAIREIGVGKAHYERWDNLDFDEREPLEDGLARA